MMDIQKQIKENAEELTDMLKDLQKWTDDIKEKDDGLKGKSTERVCKNHSVNKLQGVPTSEKPIPAKCHF